MRDQTALERVLTNLVQNAIDHGGRQGTMTGRVGENGFVEVCDEGNGLPGVSANRSSNHSIAQAPKAGVPD